MPGVRSGNLCAPWRAWTTAPVAFIHLLQSWFFSPGYHASHMDDLLRREARALNHPYPMPPHAFAAQCAGCMGHDVLDRLAGIRVPTLIVAGAQDICVPLHHARTLHRGIPGSELLVLPGGHAHHLESLEAFNAKTLAFLLSGSSN